MRLPSAQSQRERVSDAKCIASDYSRPKGKSKDGQPPRTPVGIQRRQVFFYLREAHLLRHQMQEPEPLRTIRENPDRMRRPNRSGLLETRLLRGSRSLRPQVRGEARDSCVPILESGRSPSLMENKMKASKPLSDEILTAEEVANFLRIHPSIIYRQAKRGDLPAFRVGVGGDWRFSRASFEEWLESRKQKG